MDFQLTGKRALVTAASKGIGFEIARELLKEGCEVIIASGNESNLGVAAYELKKEFGKEVFWKKCDLNNPEEVSQLIGWCVRSVGNIDILINNCGGPPAGYFEEFDSNDWDNAYRHILKSAIILTKDVLPGMKDRKWGRIVNITSIAVKQPSENLILSTAFRLGLTGTMKTLSTRYAPYNITINNVAPGYTLTSRIEELAEKKAKLTGKTLETVLIEMAEEIPMKRMGSVSEISAATVFLCSERAGYITGNTIHIDGGLIKGF